jgi:serine/threonine protein kinase
MSDNARSFITAALTKDPAKRPSVLQLLHHPWINTYRARRSMRQIPVNTAAAAASGPSSPISPQQQQQVRQVPLTPTAAATAGAAAPAMAAASGSYSPTSLSYANSAYAAKAKSALTSGNLAAAAKFARAPGSPAAAASGANSPAAADNAQVAPTPSPSSRVLLKSQLQGASSYAASPINKEKVLKMAAAAAAGSSAAAASNSSSSSNLSASGSRSARAYSSSQMQQLLQLQQQALQQQQVQHMDVDRREQLLIAPVTPQIQQQQQQGLANAASYGSSNPGASASLASKAVPVSDSPVATPCNPGSLISPRADLASSSSPFKLAAATNLKTPRDPIAALKGLPLLYGAGAESQLNSDENLRAPLMQSAKSSPLMVSDVKQLQLASGYGVPLRGEDETAVRQRKKWLLGSLKVFSQCTSPDTTEDDEL